MALLIVPFVMNLLLGTGGDPPPTAPRGGGCTGATTVPALVTVQVVDEYFRVRVTDQDTLNAMIDRCQGNPCVIVIGRLCTGNGGYNRDPVAGTVWSWHIDTETLMVADAATEVCDGLPSFVEGALEYWFDSVAVYCPWAGCIIDVAPDDSLPGDFDLDGSLDINDAWNLLNCMTGPVTPDCTTAVIGAPPCETRCFQAGDGCCATDLTCDATIDLRDVARMQILYSEPAPMPG